MRDKMCRSIMNHKEVDVVMAVEEDTKVEEDTEDIKDGDKDVKEDK